MEKLHKTQGKKVELGTLHIGQMKGWATRFNEIVNDSAIDDKVRCATLLELMEELIEDHFETISSFGSTFSTGDGHECNVASDRFYDAYANALLVSVKEHLPVPEPSGDLRRLRSRSLF